MEILNQLSSQKGDKTEDSNKIVAEKCIANPRLLAEIAVGLEDKDKKMQSDCIEVFTLVSEKKPELIVQYAENIIYSACRVSTVVRQELLNMAKSHKRKVVIILKRAIILQVHKSPFSTFPALSLSGRCNISLISGDCVIHSRLPAAIPQK